MSKPEEPRGEYKGEYEVYEYPIDPEVMKVIKLTHSCIN